MRNRHLLVPAAAVMLSLSATLPASADITNATITVAGGTLSITAPADAGNLGTRVNTVAGGTISGSLGEVQVKRRAQRSRGVGLGGQRDLHGIHASGGTSDTRKRSWLHRGVNRQGRHGDLRSEQPQQPHWCRASGDSNGNHWRQLRVVEPHNQRDGPRWHGRRRLLRYHHPLRHLATSRRRWTLTGNSHHRRVKSAIDAAHNPVSTSATVGAIWRSAMPRCEISSFSSGGSSAEVSS